MHYGVLSYNMAPCKVDDCNCYAAGHKVNERRFLKLTVSSVELKDVSQAFKDDLEDLQRDMESQTRGFQQTQS